LAAGVRLDTGLASARSLFGQSFQPSECLKALVYFEGGDLGTLLEDTRKTLIAAASAVGDIPQVPIVSRSLSLPNEHP
jgi:hypothetical protein